MDRELRCLVYPAKFEGRSTDIIDEFLAGKYDALILRHAATIDDPNVHLYPVHIDYIIQNNAGGIGWVPGRLTMTSIRRARSRHGPDAVSPHLSPYILQAIRKNRADFFDKQPVWLNPCITVRAQSSDDRDLEPPGEYQLLYITGIRKSR